MSKVLFVATVVKTHIMEFHIPYLQLFRERGWETAVAARNDYENPADCVIPFCDAYYEIPFERNPLKPQNIASYLKLKKLIDGGDYDIIHCHTPVGAMLTRLAARGARKRGTRVIYTAHGFHFYRGAPLLNWLVYYPAERFLARFTDTLITINREDYEAAKRFPAKELCYVPGVGVNTEKFRPAQGREEKRRELGFSGEEFVLLSVGELIERKNHELVLRALAELKRRGSLGGLRYVICGRGVLEPKLRALIGELGLTDAVELLGYRKDIAEICAASDLFVFMSKQEGLPVALMEAMSCGMPAVCSRIRGNTDLIEDGVNGLIVDSDPVKLADAVEKLKKSPELRKQFSENTRKSIGGYDIISVKKEMEEIYFGAGAVREARTEQKTPDRKRDD